MELYEYTDEQLRAEIRRRAAIKAKQTRDASTREKYIYWNGIIKNVFFFSGSMRLSEMQFLVQPIENDGIVYQNFAHGINVSLASDAKFNKVNIPCVGDKVKLRYRNKGNFNSLTLLDSRIVEVIERKEE